jgi:hypothetical protein
MWRNGEIFAICVTVSTIESASPAANLRKRKGAIRQFLGFNYGNDLGKKVAHAGLRLGSFSFCAHLCQLLSPPTMCISSF